MRCPSCRTDMPAAEERCSSCKFALRKADAKFGRPPRHSRYVTDRFERLELDEMQKVRRELELFEKKFPQCLLSVFVTELTPGTPVSEYAFWLANRANFSSIQQVGAENFDLLLVIDATAGAAALTVGYGLENHLEESDLDEILTAGAKAFREGDLAAGILLCIERAVQRMREISVRAGPAHAPEKSEEEVATATKMESSAAR